ncbi:hypothetical protein KM043_000287 [Ampulex compressa]|nr:hypothetical protein KM043_000287 [Ampulex compressa]
MSWITTISIRRSIQNTYGANIHQALLLLTGIESIAHGQKNIRRCDVYPTIDESRHKGGRFFHVVCYITVFTQDHATVIISCSRKSVHTSPFITKKYLMTTP